MPTKKTPLALIDRILQHENGENSGADDLELFAELIRTGSVSQLQGYYGRTAAEFILAGYIAPDGTITDKGRKWAEDAF